MADEVVKLSVVTSPNVQLQVTDDAIKLDVLTGPEVSLVIGTGLPGPQGEVGEVASYEFDFPAAAVWTINHNLGRKPQIRLLTVGGVEFDSFVQHVTNNQAVVTHNVAVAGKAVLV